MDVFFELRLFGVFLWKEKKEVATNEWMYYLELCLLGVFTGCKQAEISIQIFDFLIGFWNGYQEVIKFILVSPIRMWGSDVIIF